MAPTLVGTPLRTGYASTRSPATGNVAAAGVLQADDVVISFIRIGVGSSSAMTLIANWNNANPAGNNVISQGGSVSMVTLWHAVTAAEVTAATRSWSFTSLLNAAQTGAVYTFVVRGADPTNPIDAFGEAVSASAANPEVLAGLTGSDISNTNDVVLSCVGGDNTATYTDPANWTLGAKNGGGQNAGASYSWAGSAPTPGTNFDSTNITPSTGATYASNTVAIRAPGGNNYTGDSSLSVTPTLDASATRVPHADSSLSVTPTLTGGASVNTLGSAPLTVTPQLDASATKNQHADSSLSVTPTLAASATITRHADASLTVTPTLAADTLMNWHMNSSLSVTPQLDASGSKAGQASGTGSLTVDVALTADTTVSRRGDSALSVTPQLTASATVTKHADSAFSVTPTLDASATKIVHADSALSVTPNLSAQYLTATEHHADAALVVGVEMVADGTLYKLVPKTGWYCFPEDDLPGPPYTVPFTPGT